MPQAEGFSLKTKKSSRFKNRKTFSFKIFLFKNYSTEEVFKTDFGSRTKTEYAVGEFFALLSTINSNRFSVSLIPAVFIESLILPVVIGFTVGVITTTEAHQQEGVTLFITRGEPPLFKTLISLIRNFSDVSAISITDGTSWISAALSVSLVCTDDCTANSGSPLLKAVVIAKSAIGIIKNFFVNCILLRF